MDYSRCPPPGGIEELKGKFSLKSPNLRAEQADASYSFFVLILVLSTKAGQIGENGPHCDRLLPSAIISQLNLLAGNTSTSRQLLSSAALTASRFSPKFALS
jgi:hypothetical protein